MRADDEPGISSDLHHWLTKLEQEVTGLRTGVADLTRDLNELRVAQAKAGQPNWGVVASLVAVFTAIAVQTTYAVYWGGGVNARLDSSIAQITHYGAMVDEHIRTAVPFREMAARYQTEIDECDKRMRTVEGRQQVVMQRLDTIEARNKVADANWDLLKRKGILVESTR